MSSLESIIVNANRLAQRLKNREADADRILAGVEEVNNQLETMRQVCNLKLSFGFFVININCVVPFHSSKMIWIY